MRTIRLALLFCLSLVQVSVSADSLILDHTQRDWSQMGDLSRSQQLPVVILVSSEDCGYCEHLKQQVLLPLARSGSLEGLALIRELSMEAGGKLVDFDGERIRTRIFLSHHHVFASPTVLFLDPDGRPLHAPLVGYNGPDEYRGLLLQALKESLLTLRAVSQAPNAGS
jgi:thioredoxin-related protein